MSYRYSAYGLNFDSDAYLPVAQAVDAEGPFDFRLCFLGPCGREDSTRQARPLVYRRSGLTLRYGEDGMSWRFCFADDGYCDVQFETSTRESPCISVSMDPAIAAPYVNGLLSGWLLRRRNQIVLHAGGIAFDGGALLLAGVSNRGKSTTVAWLNARGARFVTDDIARLKKDPAGWQVYSGPPWLRLWPESVSAVDANVEPLRRVFPDATKRFLAAEQGSGRPAAITPLAAIAVLDATRPGKGPVVSRARKRDSLMELLGHIFAAELPGCDPTGEDFETMARLVDDVPVFRVANGGDLDDLPVTGIALEELMRELE